MNQPGDSRIVRGYTGGGYGLDRWLTINPKTVVLIVDGCLTFYGYENYANFEQKIGSIKSFAGKTMTLSVLRRETNADTIVGFLYDGGFSQCGVSTSELISHTFTVPEVESGNLDVFIQHMGADSIDNPHNLIAAKLEFGDHQTLARQDDTGKWMLIDPPPNKALELVTCQRTFVNLATNVYSTVGCGFIESNGDTALLIIPLPATLRTVPGITLTGTMGIVCNGETRSVNPDSITLMNVGASSICVMFGLIGNMPAGESCYGYLDPGSKLLLTAEP